MQGLVFDDDIAAVLTTVTAALGRSSAGVETTANRESFTCFLMQ
jgi:hypothetical protein